MNCILKIDSKRKWRLRVRTCRDGSKSYLPQYRFLGMWFRAPISPYNNYMRLGSRDRDDAINQIKEHIQDCND